MNNNITCPYTGQQCDYTVLDREVNERTGKVSARDLNLVPQDKLLHLLRIRSAVQIGQTYYLARREVAEVALKELHRRKPNLENIGGVAEI